jgi:hypothetical protein
MGKEQWPVKQWAMSKHRAVIYHTTLAQHFPLYGVGIAKINSNPKLIASRETK